MVSPQFRRATDDDGRKGLQRIVRQIISLNEVYDHRLGVGMSGQIDLGAYAATLRANLPNLQPQPVFPVALSCDTERLSVTFPSATALGLVLAKLISNSYERAFPSCGGSIEVRRRSCGHLMPTRVDIDSLAAPPRHSDEEPAPSERWGRHPRLFFNKPKM